MKTKTRMPTRLTVRFTYNNVPSSITLLSTF